MDRTPFDPPYTAEDLPQLDTLHDAAGIGEPWRDSERRAEIAKVADPLEAVILKLYERYGRLPTEDEVTQLIFGDDWQRFITWNKGKECFTCQAKTTPSTAIEMRTT